MAGMEQHQRVFRMKDTGRVLGTFNQERPGFGRQQICLVERALDCGLHIAVATVPRTSELATFERFGYVEIPADVAGMWQPHPKLIFKGIVINSADQKTKTGTQDEQFGFDLDMRTETSTSGDICWVLLQLRRGDEDVTVHATQYDDLGPMQTIGISTFSEKTHPLISLNFKNGGLDMLHYRNSMYQLEAIFRELEYRERTGDLGSPFKPHAAALITEAKRRMQRIQNAGIAKKKHMLDFDLVETVGAIIKALEQDAINTSSVFSNGKEQGLIRFREVEV